MNTKTYTLRGYFDEGTVKRLVVDDGRLNHAMRITKFIVAPRLTAAGNDCIAVLGLQGNFPLIWDWSDNNQIAWAGMTGLSVASPYPEFSLIDKNHLIVRDLYITGQVLGTGGTDKINYYIEMEAVEISYDESILQLIKERSQGELRA